MCGLKIDDRASNWDWNLVISERCGYFYVIVGKWAHVSIDSKQVPPPMNTRNTRGDTIALSAFWGCGGMGGGFRDWATGIFTHSVQRKCCYKPVFCEAMVSFRLSRIVRRCSKKDWKGHALIVWPFREDEWWKTHARN